MYRFVIFLSLIISQFINTTVSRISPMEVAAIKKSATRESQPSNVTEVNLPLPISESNLLEKKDVVGSELVQNLLQGAYTNGFDLFDFLESLQPSECLQVCLDEVASMLEQPFAGQRSVDEVGNICSCKDSLLDVTTTVIDYLCTFNQEALGDIFPCLYGHSAVIYLTCDNQCEMGEVLSKASRGKKPATTNVLDSSGNKLLEIPNLYDLCSASSCFINCTQQMAEKQCSIGRSSLLHKIVATVVNHTIKMNPSPNMKSEDAYTLLVSSILPGECQRLKLLPQDVVLTTSKADFTDTIKGRSGDSVTQLNAFNSKENDAIRTIPDKEIQNQTNSIYVQILPLNEHQMKLQCQLIDLETGQGATVADIATLMTSAAKNIFNEFGLRSVEEEKSLQDKNVKYWDKSGFQVAKITGGKKPENHDEAVIVLDDTSDSFELTEEAQRSHRIILESHSFVEAEGLNDVERLEQPQHRLPRVILSSDEEADDDNVNKKRRRKSDRNDDEGGDETTNCSICFEAYTISGSHKVVCLKCGHLFGQSCIERWIRTEKSAKCPQCKTRARITDIRRLYVRSIKALDTTELESLKEANNAYKAENGSLRLENERLKEKITKESECVSYKAEVERLKHENAQLRAKIACEERRGNKSRPTTPPAAKLMKGAYFSLIAGPTIQLSSEPGSRSLDANGEFFVITADGREDTVIPVHTRKPRCCRFSPFNRQMVLSTGEDKTLCVTSFDDHPRIQQRIPLPASGWCCCWLSENDVAVGLINGRVLKFRLQDSAIEPFDITCRKGRLPIISLQFCTRQSLLFVTSLKECVLYHHMQPHVLISDQGSINSFCYDQESNNVMLTFAPSQRHETVTHILYSLDLDGECKKLCHIHTYKSLSKKLTRVIRSAFWSTPCGPVAAVYDEANSHVVLYDWVRKCPTVVKRVNDMVVDIREIITNDMQHFQLGCLSETAIYFLEARC
uniref:RING-type E3 ubiquitin transferase n=1 Tax=Setaria digitata TaxID=48799 RepID=A0A915PYB5_9BILA